MNIKSHFTQKGFTLFEVLLTALIVSVIIGACTLVLIAGSRFWNLERIKTELNQEIRKSVNWITEDLREGGYNEPTLNASIPADGNWEDSISFKKPTGVNNGNIVWSADPVDFSRSGNDLLTRQEGTNVRVIAQYIKELEFRRQSTSMHVVEIALEAEKDALGGRTINIARTFKVELRN